MREAIGVEAFYDEDGGAIYHGDCLRVLPALPAGSVDLVLTDPPYLMNYQGGWDAERKAIVGDEVPRWLIPAYRELWRVLKPDTFAVSSYGWPHADLFVGVFKEIGSRPESHLAFVKNVWGSAGSPAASTRRPTCSRRSAHRCRRAASAISSSGSGNRAWLTGRSAVLRGPRRMPPAGTSSFDATHAILGALVYTARRKPMGGSGFEPLTSTV